jgi:exodeoxyribonuclease V alpha subunit
VSPANPVTLTALLEAQVISSFDRQLALRLRRLSGERDPRVVLAAALASRAPSRGHVCVDLARPLLSDPDSDSDSDPEREQSPRWAWPELAEWTQALSASALVGDGRTASPLVFDGGRRLYLYRYWRYQTLLLDEIERRAAVRRSIRRDSLSDRLSELFPGGEGQPSPNLQKVAVQLAVERGLCVISGGPGTGKTTTVVKLLAALQEKARDSGLFPLHVALVAPTGKAAARLSQSIKSGKAKLVLDDEIRESIPEEAATIHRCLGWQPRTPTRFRHDAQAPLPVDVLVCDEASMVDLPSMAKLFQALPSSARLILLGDRHQLASVEAGSVLGDVCDPEALAGGYSAQTAASLLEISGEALPIASPTPPPLRDCIVELTHSYRFDAEGGIGALAAAINSGETQAAMDLLRTGAEWTGRGGEDCKLEWTPAEASSDPGALLGDRLCEGFRTLVRERDPLQAVKALEAFGVLCAHRQGRFGVEGLNLLARQRLAAANLVPAKGRWFAGRPVMVVRNDYQVGLFNGDVGVTLPEPGEPSRLRVHFLAPDGASTQSYTPAQLPDHVDAFALTIHKSQGSEFDEVLVVLPPTPSAILTRELFYTGVTRARFRATLVGAEAVARAAIAQRVQRASGLHALLWESALPASLAEGGSAS